jgi:transcriptional regulator with XRE-family HTH domain
MTPDELKQRRDRLGLTQEQLADRLGVARNTLARWEIAEGEDAHRKIPEVAVRLLAYVEREVRAEKRKGTRRKER